VRNSTRPMPFHSNVSWVTRSPPRENSAISRDPIGQVSARTTAGPPPDPCPAPFGDSSHGPSPQRGCAPYSSASTSSLPRPFSNSAPVRASATRVSAPPRPGSASATNDSLPITVPGVPAHPALPSPVAGCTQYVR
jgi:hypothetical protein